MINWNETLFSILLHFKFPDRWYWMQVFHKRFTHYQHEIEVAVFIGYHGGRHQRRQFEKEQFDNEEH